MIGSFLGQLGSLGLTLFKSGLDVVSMMKNAVNENIIQRLLNSDETTGYEKEKMKKELRAFKLKQLIADVRNKSNPYLFYFLKAMKFFERNSGNIEVLRGPIIEKVYFTLPTYCQFLPEVRIFILSHIFNFGLELLLLFTFCFILFFQ